MLKVRAGGKQHLGSVPGSAIAFTASLLKHTPACVLQRRDSFLRGLMARAIK